MALFRHHLGEVLRGERLRRGLTLRELSAAARVSLGYISEIERGQKEASSELLAALCQALDLPLSEVLRGVGRAVAADEAAAALPRLAEPLVIASSTIPATIPAGRGARVHAGRDVVASAA